VKKQGRPARISQDRLSAALPRPAVPATIGLSTCVREVDHSRHRAAALAASPQRTVQV